MKLLMMFFIFISFNASADKLDILRKNLSNKVNNYTINKSHRNNIDLQINQKQLEITKLKREVNNSAKPYQEKQKRQKIDQLYQEIKILRQQRLNSSSYHRLIHLR
jgi:septal ring factor EnvC (AmiA/AmiB activator)